MAAGRRARRGLTGGLTAPTALVDPVTGANRAVGTVRPLGRVPAAALFAHEPLALEARHHPVQVTLLHTCLGGDFGD